MDVTNQIKQTNVAASMQIHFSICTFIKFERIEPTLRYAFILANTELNTLVGRRKFVVPLSTMVLPKLYCNKENMHSHSRIQRGRGQRGRDPPPEKSQNIGFFSNTGLDPLKNHKATKPAFNVVIIGTSAKHHSGPLADPDEI